MSQVGGWKNRLFGEERSTLSEGKKQNKLSGKQMSFAERWGQSFASSFTPVKNKEPPATKNRSERSCGFIAEFAS